MKPMDLSMIAETDASNNQESDVRGMEEGNHHQQKNPIDDSYENQIQQPNIFDKEEANFLHVQNQVEDIDEGRIYINQLSNHSLDFLGYRSSVRLKPSIVRGQMLEKTFLIDNVIKKFDSSVPIMPLVISLAKSKFCNALGHPIVISNPKVNRTLATLRKAEFGFFGVIVEKLTDKSSLLPLYGTVYEIFTSYGSSFNSFEVIGSFSKFENPLPSSILSRRLTRTNLVTFSCSN
ncbi:hypothetical protein E3N88_24014 [Mikania micrantha]|uniref:Maturase K n=1 Tax=Mikania micrantha TaxID=192012 RepID=A0A5N6NGN3_9ASTR|nr:hypothetical protein E3N88_24014 [Mikania micrantha]